MLFLSCLRNLQEDDCTSIFMANQRKVTFETHLAKLEAIVEGLEQGEVSLEELVMQYEAGTRHLVEAQRILKTAELRIEQLRQKATGKIETEPFLPEKTE